MFLGIPAGGWLVACVTLGVALLAILQRRTPEATSLARAWEHIAELERENGISRRAQRISEEGFDALWKWGRRVREDWGSPEPVPAFTSDEDRAIRRARHSTEIAETAPTEIIRQPRSSAVG